MVESLCGDSMRINYIDSDEGCANQPGSAQPFCFVVRYNGYISAVEEIFNPFCVDVINNQYLIAYVQPENAGIEEYLSYGYEYIPDIYGLMENVAIEATNTNLIRSLPGLGMTGEGTVVTIIDTGIDYTMDIFRRPDGSTRIKYIWDMGADNNNTSDSGEAVNSLQSPYGIGRLYDEQQINAALKSDNPFSVVSGYDENGHGTFLASVAAGSYDRENMYEGLSPEADIVVIKLREAPENLRRFYLVSEEIVCFSEADVMLALKFAIEAAKILGKPNSICLGIGSNQGAHEGRTVLEQYISQICTQRGIAVSCAVGNELGYGTHFHGEYSKEWKEFELFIGGDERGFSMELWGRAPALMELQVISPTGEMFELLRTYESYGKQKTFLLEGTSLYVENVVVEKNTGDQLIFLRFERPLEGVWRFRTRTNEFVSELGFDAWLPIHTFISEKTRFATPDEDVTICSPGCAKEAITVGAYNPNGNVIYLNSSRGFLRGGYIKPDMVAPGVGVSGAFARRPRSVSDNIDVPGNEQINEYNTFNLYTTINGTSVAAAVLSGICSLVLEWAIVYGNMPNMNCEDIKQFLIRGAARYDNVSYPSRSYGWGSVDLLSSFVSNR